MEIILPCKYGSKDTLHLNDNKNIVVIGANGTGKTRFGTDIEERYPVIVHRISAQKSLTMPELVSPSSINDACMNFWYGYNYKTESISIANKMHNRYGDNPNTQLLNDYDKLMVLLFTEEFAHALAYKNGQIEKPITKLDLIQKIWEKVFTHRKLRMSAGKVLAYPIDVLGEQYNASEMSDGERVAFYLIGEVLCAKDNSIIIVDEPETHLHRAIVSKLWDEIEKVRLDCKFVYLTHDIDFATSRVNAHKIWLKSYKDKQWDYDILTTQNEIPENIYLEILGSRLPILFIEGSNNSSIDIRIYPYLFPEFTIKPLGGCLKVIEMTKAFSSYYEFHHICSKGIVDRDRRSEGDILNLNDNNIYVADVSEIENLLLKEVVVKAVASRMGKDEIIVFSEVKKKVINKFASEIEAQALLYTKYTMRRILEGIAFSKKKSLKEYKANIKEEASETKIQDIYDSFISTFCTYISKDNNNLIDYDKSNYNEIIKVYNQKGLFFESKVTTLCGLANQDEYVAQLALILKQQTKEAKQLRTILRKCFGGL